MTLNPGKRSVEDGRPEARPSDWCYGWEGALESVQDARARTRGQAIATYCADTGEWFPAVRAWKRHARALTRLDNYVWWVETRTDGGWDEHPDKPPEDWQPDLSDEEMPAWEICRPADDGAVPVWIVGTKDTTPPRRL